MITNRVITMREVEWQKLHDLQPENLKVPFNGEILKNSLLKHGFSMPFFGWENEGKVFIIDGHTRHEVLTELVADGIEVPATLPIVLLACKDRQDAIKTLLEVYNSKRNNIAGEVLGEWMDMEDIEMEDIEMETLDISPMIVENEESEAPKDNENNKIVLEYTSEDYEAVRNELTKYGNTPEDAVFNLLKL